MKNKYFKSIVLYNYLLIFFASILIEIYCAVVLESTSSKRIKILFISAIFLYYQHRISGNKFQIKKFIKKLILYIADGRANS